MPVFTPTFEWGRSGQAGSHRPHVISSVSQLNPKCQRRFGKAEHVESGGAHLGFSALLMRWSRCDWPPPGPLGLVTTTWMFCPHLLRITASCRPQVGKGAGAEDIGFPKWTVGEATKLPGSSVAPLTPRVAPEPPRSMQASTVVCSHSYLQQVCWAPRPPQSTVFTLPLLRSLRPSPTPGWLLCPFQTQLTPLLQEAVQPSMWPSPGPKALCSPWPCPNLTVTCLLPPLTPPESRAGRGKFSSKVGLHFAVLAPPPESSLAIWGSATPFSSLP
jgi:hypothetical protein